MNRGDIVRRVAKKADLPVSQVDRVLTHVLDAISEGLCEGQRVNVRRFGKFEPRWRDPVVRKNPLSGVEVNVPGKTSVGFVPSINLKALMNAEDDDLMNDTENGSANGNNGEAT